MNGFQNAERNEEEQEQRILRNIAQKNEYLRLHLLTALTLLNEGDLIFIGSLDNQYSIRMDPTSTRSRVQLHSLSNVETGESIQHDCFRDAVQAHPGSSPLYSEIHTLPFSLSTLPLAQQKWKPLGSFLVTVENKLANLPDEPLATSLPTAMSVLGFQCSRDYSRSEAVEHGSFHYWLNEELDQLPLDMTGCADVDEYLQAKCELGAAKEYCHLYSTCNLYCIEVARYWLDNFVQNWVDQSRCDRPFFFPPRTIPSTPFRVRWLTTPFRQVEPHSSEYDERYTALCDSLTQFEDEWEREDFNSDY